MPAKAAHRSLGEGGPPCLRMSYGWQAALAAISPSHLRAHATSIIPSSEPGGAAAGGRLPRPPETVTLRVPGGPAKETSEWNPERTRSSTRPKGRSRSVCSRRRRRRRSPTSSGLAEGTKEWKDPATGEKKNGPVLRRRRLSPRHQRLHDPGGRPARDRHRRAGLQVRRRVPSVAPAHEDRHPVDGQRRAEHQRQPVLHHARARRRISTTGTRSSAKSSRGSTSSRRSARCRPAGRIGRSSRS